MRKPIIAGNWKMNVLPSQAARLVEDLWNLVEGYSEVEVVVCPPSVDIPAVSRVISEKGMDIGLGAQDMHWAESGAYTGEVSASMLIDLGVSYVVTGHSERRQLFNETDQGVNRKVTFALQKGLRPIMCVGETLKERENGQTEEKVTNQVKCGLFELDSEAAASVTVAYEPIWAIGTGKAATPEDAEQVVKLIREVLSEEFGAECSQKVRIQYGGSVKPDNIADFMAKEDIDGALVGGASLKADDFARIVKY